MLNQREAQAIIRANYGKNAVAIGNSTNNDGTDVIFWIYNGEIENDFKTHDCVLTPIPLKSLQKGAWFVRKPINNPSEKQVFAKEDYDRTSKTYSCYRFSDWCDYISLKGDTIVYIGFTF